MGLGVSGTSTKVSSRASRPSKFTAPSSASSSSFARQASRARSRSLAMLRALSETLNVANTPSRTTEATEMTTAISISEKPLRPEAFTIPPPREKGELHTGANVKSASKWT